MFRWIKGIPTIPDIHIPWRLTYKSLHLINKVSCHPTSATGTLYKRHHNTEKYKHLILYNYGYSLHLSSREYHQRIYRPQHINQEVVPIESLFCVDLKKGHGRRKLTSVLDSFLIVLPYLSLSILKSNLKRKFKIRFQVECFWCLICNQII